MQLLANPTSPYVRVAMIEKGLEIEPTLVDPLADDPRLRAANAATRVPTLLLDDGTPLAESLLIVPWLELARPAPAWPSLTGRDAATAAGVLSRAGIALGAIDAAVHTIITRKVTVKMLFDETPVGLRRRRTRVEGLQRLAAPVTVLGGARTGTAPGSAAPTLDAICAVVLYGYQQLRFADQPWLPTTRGLQALAEALQQRPSFARTMPRAASSGGRGEGRAGRRAGFEVRNQGAHRGLGGRLAAGAQLHAPRGPRVDQRQHLQVHRVGEAAGRANGVRTTGS